MSTGIRSETILSHGIRSEKVNNLIFIPSLKNSFKHKADLLDQIYKIVKYGSLKMVLLLKNSEMYTKWKWMETLEWNFHVS